MRDHDKDTEKNTEPVHEEGIDETTEPTISDPKTHASDFQDQQNADAKEESTEHNDGEQIHQHSQQKKSAHDAKQEELKNAFGRVSQVGRSMPFLQKKSTWMILLVGGVLLIFLMGGHHVKEEKKKAEAKIQAQELIRSAVAQRIDREKGKKNPEAPRAGEEKGLAGQALVDDGAYTKEMIARMNAPTSIYEGGTSSSTVNTQSTTGASTDSTVQEATFIGKGPNQDFANTNYQTTSVEAKQVPHPESTIMSGEMIHATLNVAMNSDLPGMVTATVTSPAYSYTGDNELIPRGSRLIGQYSSAVLQGQDRIFIMWNRVVLPNGISVDINSPDTDSIGQAGEPADYINRHFWSRFGESILLSILSAGVSNIDVQSSDQYNSAQAYRIGIAESLQASATGTLQQSISLKPTLVRYQGATINVFIAHDLSFYNVLNQAEPA